MFYFSRTSAYATSSASASNLGFIRPVTDLARAARARACANRN